MIHRFIQGVYERQRPHVQMRCTSVQARRIRGLHATDTVLHGAPLSLASQSRSSSPGNGRRQSPTPQAHGGSSLIPCPPVPPLDDDDCRRRPSVGRCRGFPEWKSNLTNEWPLVREAQFREWREVPRTGLAVTYDVGNSENLHPPNKQIIGRRLGLWAEKMVYGRDVACSGPMFRALKLEEGLARVSFDFADSGLAARSGVELLGFETAGADRRFVPARANEAGPDVIISSPEVPQPVAVRYVWGDDPVGNLVNGNGLPASPFRTDNWAVP